MSGPVKSLIGWFEFSLFQNPEFLSLLAVMFASVYGFQSWIVYLIPNAVDKGLSPYRATALAATGGVGQLIGLAGTGVGIDTGICTVNVVSIGIEMLTV